MVEIINEKFQTPQPSETKQEFPLIDMNTNSEIGSAHWFNTLMGMIIRMGEFISDRPVHENNALYGNKIMQISKHICHNLKSINNVKPSETKSAEEIMFSKHFHCDDELKMILTYDDAVAGAKEYAQQSVSEVNYKDLLLEYSKEIFLDIYDVRKLIPFAEWLNNKNIAEQKVVSDEIPVKELEQLFHEISQVFDGWKQDDPKAWSEYDIQVRKHIDDFRIKYTYKQTAK